MHVFIVRVLEAKPFVGERGPLPWKRTAFYALVWSKPLTVTPDPTLQANKDLRFIGETLVGISRVLHEQTHKLELAVEGTYAAEAGDPRVRLLSEALHVSRSADLQLGRINEAAKRVLFALQDQLNKGEQALVPSLAGALAISQNPSSFDIINSLERTRSELETLYKIAQVLNSTLELKEVLRLVMDQVIKFIGAERGFIVLVDPKTNKQEPESTIARDKYAHTIDRSAFEYNISRSTVDRVVKTKKLVRPDNTYDPTKSMMDFDIRSVMCAPLIVRGDCIGAVYVDSRMKSNLFTEEDEKLLLSFCNQTAITINNARLFSKVKEDKQYMDNIFASIASGVIATDSAGIVTTFNRAAGEILGLNPYQVVGRHYKEAFQALPQLRLAELLEDVIIQHQHGTIVAHSIDGAIPRRGLISLDVHPSSLLDEGVNIGMALVIDDRTEIKRAKAEAKEIRAIFGRYVHPNVVQQLIEDPKALNLGGEIKEISVISADIRGFTSLSEGMPSKDVMTLLNNYFEIMVKEIWDEEGTVTGYWGDMLMAIFNAPLRQDDHALRAVRAAWKMRMAILAYQCSRPQGPQISFGIGVNTGEAVVGNLGSHGRMQNYTAIGDVVNVASRLQGKASDNNILLNHSTFVKARQHVKVDKLPPMTVRNRTVPLDVWHLKGLL
jgi:adenylate cyclase